MERDGDGDRCSLDGLNADERPDLVFVGDWEAVRFWINGTEEFVSLPNSEGWWNSLKLADMDQDGDMDMIVGNLGLNSQIKANPEESRRTFL